VCIPAENRTLKGGRHDAIYNFFESNRFCDTYVKDDKFLFFIKTCLLNFKGKPIEKINKDEYSTMVNCINDFILEYDGWKAQLGNISVTNFFNFMETNRLWPVKTANHLKGKSAYMTLCYYLGMIALDT
jgi:hypothetical protein